MGGGYSRPSPPKGWEEPENDERAYKRYAKRMPTTNFDPVQWGAALQLALRKYVSVGTQLFVTCQLDPRDHNTIEVIVTVRPEGHTTGPIFHTLISYSELLKGEAQFPEDELAATLMMVG